jgi:hypothetical protein
MQIPTEAATISPSEGRWRLSVVDPASADQKFRYFTERVIRCQIWRDEDGSLFTRLKVATQDLMDRIAVRCDSRSAYLDFSRRAPFCGWNSELGNSADL